MINRRLGRTARQYVRQMMRDTCVVVERMARIEAASSHRKTRDIQALVYRRIEKIDQRKTRHTMLMALRSGARVSGSMKLEVTPSGGGIRGKSSILSICLIWRNNSLALHLDSRSCSKPRGATRRAHKEFLACPGALSSPLLALQFSGFLSARGTHFVIELSKSLSLIDHEAICMRNTLASNRRPIDRWKSKMYHWVALELRQQIGRIRLRRTHSVLWQIEADDVLDAAGRISRLKVWIMTQLHAA